MFLDDADQVEDGEGDNEEYEEDEAGVDHSIHLLFGEPDGEYDPDPGEDDEGYQCREDLSDFIL